MSDTVKHHISLVDENGSAIHSGFVYIKVPEELEGRKRVNYIQKLSDRLHRGEFTITVPLTADARPDTPMHKGVRLP